jgi:hypothetical protein
LAEAGRYLILTIPNERLQLGFILLADLLPGLRLGAGVLRMLHAPHVTPG